MTQPAAAPAQQGVLEIEVRTPSADAASKAPAPPAPPATAPAAPAAAPAEAPVPPASFAPAPPPPAPAALPDVVVEYAPTGDKGLDVALAYIGELGFGPDRPEMQAAMKGDFAPLEATLKGLGDKAKNYPRYLDLAKDAYTSKVKARESAEAKINKAVVEAAGGEAAWREIHAWVSAEASPEQKEQITKALASGEYAAQAMALQLAALYRQSGKSTLPPKGAVKPGAGTASSAPPEGMTKTKFRETVRQLEAKHGARLDETDEYKAAVAARAAYRQQYNS